jgi:hypothetical protein
MDDCSVFLSSRHIMDNPDIARIDMNSLSTADGITSSTDQPRNFFDLPRELLDLVYDMLKEDATIDVRETTDNDTKT